MQDTEAINILKGLLEKKLLSEREEEAVRAAIGIFSWTKLVEGWKKNVKKNRDKKFGNE